MLQLTILLSVLSYVITMKAIPKCKNAHLRRGLCGRDINKAPPKDADGKDIEKKIPESMGLQSCGAYLFSLIIISVLSPNKIDLYPALVSVIITTLLGFADDVLDIPWRIKIFIPLFTVLPLVLDYQGSTTICLHGFLQPLKHVLKFECIDIGIFYQIFIALLTVFCTHSINIYAGINGLEAGQSLIVACFLLFHSLYYYQDDSQARAAVTILLPFITSTFALLHFNWFPSEVFVGDTFTLTAGATIAAAGILGHFSEMTLLFMLPQLINFVLSLPQLVGIVFCPRHRLPTRNPETGKLEGKKSNLNVVNWWLILFGPKTESRLCVELLIFQVVCCIGAYGIKYLYNNSLTP
jgi:UDP-N-acetylglucosamine--dolichyl-phosphate N-acetylglucosaminephosphotransferase